MTAIERGLAVLIPPVAAAAFAALKLLAQFRNLFHRANAVQVLRTLAKTLKRGAHASASLDFISSD